MELVYAYVEKFSNVLENKQYNFSRNLDIEINKESKKLRIKEDENIFNIFGSNIINISAVVGKNGTGKTTLLDLLGLKYYQRREEDDSYFILYRIDNNTYKIEGVGLKLLKQVVEETQEHDKFIRTNQYSIICSYESGKLYIKEIITSEKRDNRVKYINISKQYSLRHGNSFRNRSHTSINLFERLFPTYNLYTKYKCISNLLNNKNNKLGFYNDNIYMEIKYRDIEVDLEKCIKLYQKEYQEDVNILLLHNIGTMFMQNKFSFKYCYRGEQIEESISKNDYSRIYALRNFIFEIYKDILQNNKNIDYIKQVKSYLDNKCNNVLEKAIINEKLDYDILIKGLLNIIKDIKDDSNKTLINEEQLQVYEDWIDGINQLDKKNITPNGFKININNKKYNTQEWLYLLNNYLDENMNIYNRIYGIIDAKFYNMSYGQEQIIDILCKINNVIESIDSSHLSSVENIILLLDEPDNAFHPEWSRKFIDLLIKSINEIKSENEYLKSKFQVILTTHSPFIVSDLPKENILILDNKKSNKYNELGNTFGANIHMLLSNNFFMDSTIGEFAKTKIIECISFMDRYKKNQLNKEEKNCIDIKKKEISYIISQIGEPVIKNRLEKLFKETFTIEKNENELKIKKLEEEIIKLKGIIKNSKVDDIDGIIEILVEKVNELKNKNGELL